ncbi:tubulin family protein [Entamoeba histolytica HM-1:IMSS-B]|uniref:Tubulin beta chain n=7 Tax=Entamoeba histolytica TaxID=5759 RepID=C4LUJ0_ENTH1|nr:beta-tubulin, putative [Entamoeba histolytica HM-1:IMSS]EMD45372.1 tubulin beta chain, putative [Entamoeba histolytica KU27]EMH76391.1 tubulin family protein [Entamoeba histolytica HM-1:IMSS-B]EMS15514.1 tubulin beta-4q chain [Entamoeba histolytica HM-3:IMSS]ENY60372.1 tubulin beta-4q chain, putative [Entamoeba histolytica HM-1:IMSS-A]GAT92279.1 tubulin family protein [Entamoeba histolytica]|eukprot:XP_657170.1 beta-tubulin, putative [Entamoeba histolytica HM-1:IMSS]
MREIICLQIGQCGNQVGEKFWDIIGQEHGLSPDGIFNGNKLQQQRLNVYFSESSTKRYVPRSINVDLEPGTLDTIKSGKMGHFFKPDSFIFGHGGAGNNWAKGHYTEGTEICETIMESVRKEAEACECLQGFQVTHSLGGGTGSGLGTLLLSKLKDEFFEKVISTFSVVPSPTVSETVVEPYNCTLSVHKLLESSGVTFCFDNEALFKIASDIMKEPKPSYESLNSLISSVMSGITCSLRFPGQLNQDLKKLTVNMIPYPRLHFFSSSIAPVSSALSMQYESLSVQEIIQQLFDRKNMMVDLDPASGKYLTASCIMRGKVSTHDVEEQLYKIREKNPDAFVPWIPNNMQLAVCDIPPKGLNLSGTFIGNSTSIMDLFQRVNSQFLSMFKRKAFLHLYTEEGMEESEFSEATADLIDLVNEYRQYDKASPEVDDEQPDQEGELLTEVHEDSLAHSPTNQV